MERSPVHSQSSARRPCRTSGLRPQGDPAGVGWKPPGLSVSVIVPQTRVESRLGLEILEVADGHQKTVAAMLHDLLVKACGTFLCVD